MNYQIITQQSDLKRVCDQAQQSDVVMLDTEFVRIRTFYPLLGLIQLFDGENLSLIDPTVFEDMTPFVDLLKNTSVMKVLHACGEDLEVFQNAFGCTPFPMVDTQIMAAFLGHGLSTGFASLVNEYIGVELDKSESRTDWMARPLSVKQLEYAAADVFYLMPLYEKLLEKTSAAGWWDAAQEESELLVSKRIKDVDANNVYRDIKGAWQLKPKQLAILKPLATWRYKEAMKRDLALNFVFKETDLLLVARDAIKSNQQMEQEGIDGRAVRRHGNRIAAMIKSAEQTPQDEYPAAIDRLMDYPGYKQLFKLLKDEVKKASAKSGLATEFLASKKQLNQLLSWVWRKDRNPSALPDVMKGWRLELMGENLNKLVK
ncbi:ribonuclease D [Vibrio sp. 10N.261.55.A7]|uniref:ribonuclease D n=1 Tax=Vibrio sp. 10N.261.55.A7 TaxID=1880851 RepID=UPI000CAE4E7F|nr:ribonuclease D [Vibrio sp. 10N.261.55.A7]PMK00472.1 ribonuclease D [Vibrio sp. 10N.261.55.A7]